VDSDLGPIGDRGSENRTRFLGLLGVAGGVEIPWTRDTEVWELDRERVVAPTPLRLFLRRDIGSSLSAKFSSSTSSMVEEVWWGKSNASVGCRCRVMLKRGKTAIESGKEIFLSGEQKR
jgi:hypothetical protein